MTPENKALLARMNKARNFPSHTCPASRHTAMIAEYLAKKKPYPMLREEPEHVAGSLAATVAALWEARKAIAQARAEALQEAARVAERFANDDTDASAVAEMIAAAIRSLPGAQG